MLVVQKVSEQFFFFTDAKDMLILIFCAINARQSINRLGSSNITLAVVEAIGYFDFLTGLKKNVCFHKVENQHGRKNAGICIVDPF